MSKASRYDGVRKPAIRLGRVAAHVGAVVLAAALAACGASSTSQSGGQTTRSTTTTASSTGGTSSITAGPVRGALTPQNHAPKVGKPWRYSVRVTDASGRPMAGTVEIQFLFGGMVVGRDTPATHPVKNGRWRDTMTFPGSAVGHPLTFRAVVHTRAGSITLDWPITVEG